MQRQALKKRHSSKKGFTIIEVSLFLALAGLLLVGILISVSGSINRHRFYDSAQDVAEFFRNVYSDVLNPKNDLTFDNIICNKDEGGELIINNSNTSVKGTSNCAVYGRLITFASTTVANTYYVVGLADIAQFDKDTKLYVVTQTETSFSPVWGATMESAILDSEGNGKIIGDSILIIRNPSGGVHTYRLPGDVLDKGNTALPVIDFATTKIDICVASSDSINDSRYDVRLAADGANTSAVQIVSLGSDDDSCKKIRASYNSPEDEQAYYVYRDAFQADDDGVINTTYKGYILTFDVGYLNPQSVPLQRRCAPINGVCEISKLPTAVRSEYELLGWSSKPNSETVEYDIGDTIAIRSSTTLYAVWRKLPILTLSFDTKTNTIDAPDTRFCKLSIFTTFCTIKKLPKLDNRKEYTFKGWSTDQFATVATYAAYDSISISADTTLYAVWQLNSYTLSVTQGAGSSLSIIRTYSALSQTNSWETLSNGSTIYYGDILNISVSARSGYRNAQVSPSGVKNVTGDISVSSSASVSSYSISCSGASNRGDSANLSAKYFHVTSCPSSATPGSTVTITTDIDGYDFSMFYYVNGQYFGTACFYYGGTEDASQSFTMPEGNVVVSFEYGTVGDYACKNWDKIWSGWW